MPKLAECLQADNPRQQFELRLGKTRIPCCIGGNIALVGIRGMKGKVVTFENLTELRLLQEEMKHHDRLATLGRFSAGLAHEIRNPLAAMSGCIELLTQDTTIKKDTENFRMIQIIQRESDRLSNLVKDFPTMHDPNRLIWIWFDLERLWRVRSMPFNGIGNAC